MKNFDEIRVKELLNKTVLQRNMVYITNLPYSIHSSQTNKQIEDQLKQEENFGQYGKILSLYVNTRVLHNLNSTSGPSFSCYITYETEELAKECIKSVDQCIFHDKTLNAAYGTSKYCVHFLKGEVCKKADNCSFLHRFSESDEYVTKASLDKGVFKDHKPLPFRRAYNSHGVSCLPPLTSLIPYQDSSNPKKFNFKDGRYIIFESEVPLSWRLENTNGIYCSIVKVLPSFNIESTFLHTMVMFNEMKWNNLMCTTSFVYNDFVPSSIQTSTTTIESENKPAPQPSRVEKIDEGNKIQIENTKSDKQEKSTNDQIIIGNVIDKKTVNISNSSDSSNDNNDSEHSNDNTTNQKHVHKKRKTKERVTAKNELGDEWVTVNKGNKWKHVDIDK